MSDVSVCKCGCKGYELENGLCPVCNHRNDLRQRAYVQQIETLQAILDRHVSEFEEQWPGCEFGKSLVGNAITEAIRQLGGTPHLTKDALKLVLP